MKSFLLAAVVCFAAALPGDAQQTVFGCHVHPADSIFYTRIDALPLLPQSATYTANMGATVSLSFDSSFGITPTKSTDPTFQAQFEYTPGYSGTWRNPAWNVTNREIGHGIGAADHHEIYVDVDTCQIWEMYGDHRNPDGSFWLETYSGRQCNAQSGWQYNASSYALPTQGTTDAAGLPLLPLTWLGHEIMDGTLNHALRLTLVRGYIQAGHPMWPAGGTNGWGGVNNPPYGTRFRLSAAGASTISLNGLTPIQQQYANTIINALKQYGLVLADVGSTMNAGVDDEADQNPDIMKALSQVGGQIKSPQLEAVDQSSLMASSRSYKAGTAPSPQPTPTVGLPYGTYLTVQAGVPVQLTGWTHDTPSQALTWSASTPLIGTITAAGVYTPPASATGLLQGVITATSVSSPSTSATLYVRVLPNGPIRIAAGATGNSITDKNGNVWQPGIVLRGGDSTRRGGDYPAWPIPADPTEAAELAVHEGYFYTAGNDIVADHWRVPNGWYNIHWLFGQPYNGSNNPATCVYTPTWHKMTGIEVQGVTINPDFDFGALTNPTYKCALPYDMDTPATVTDGTLSFALRNAQSDKGVLPNGSHYQIAPMLSGIEITQVQPAVAAGWINVVSVNSGKCLDVVGGPNATATNIRIQQWSCLGAAQTNQLFQLIPVTGGGYELQAKNSGLAIGVNGGSTANGAYVDQTPFTSATYQVWTVTPAANGAYTLHPASDPSSCMDVSGISQNNGAGIQQWNCTGGTNQEWKLTPIIPITLLKPPIPKPGDPYPPMEG